MKWGQFILPSCCLWGCFLGIDSLGLSEFRHGTRKRLPDFWGNIFALKNWGNRPKRDQKSFFFHFKEWSLIFAAFVL